MDGSCGAGGVVRAGWRFLSPARADEGRRRLAAGLRVWCGLGAIGEGGGRRGFGGGFDELFADLGEGEVGGVGLLELG